MLHRIIVSAVALSLATGSVALAQSAETNAGSTAIKQGQGASTAILSRLDRDGDGTVNADEFGGERIELLRNADADGDGQLSRDDLAAFLIDRDYQRRAERASRRLDIDGDGTVTLAEIEEHHGKRFALMDRNNDGELSQSELHRSAFTSGMHHMDGKRRKGQGLVRRGERPHHVFKHRPAPVTQSAPSNTPAED